MASHIRCSGLPDLPCVVIRARSCSRPRQPHDFVRPLRSRGKANKPLSPQSHLHSTRRTTLPFGVRRDRHSRSTTKRPKREPTSTGFDAGITTPPTKSYSMYPYLAIAGLMPQIVHSEWRDILKGFLAITPPGLVRFPVEADSVPTLNSPIWPARRSAGSAAPRPRSSHPRGRASLRWPSAHAS